MGEQMGLYKLKPAVDLQLDLMMSDANPAHFLMGCDYFSEEKKSKTSEM